MEALAIPEQTEKKIQERIISYLRTREWMVEVLHGNEFQSGIPDLYATHPTFGQRMIEVKKATLFSFTPAQIKKFPLLKAHGTQIWILTDATEEQYKLLFKPCNLDEFLTCYYGGCKNIIAWRAGRRF
jgi:hypothetical protein